MLLGLVAAPDSGECINICNQTADCNWFTEYYPDNLCGLFSSMEEILTDHCPTCISGHKWCTTEGCNMPGMCEGVLILLEADIPTEQGL